MYMLGCFFTTSYILLHSLYCVSVCYWSCLCCYRMLPSVKTYINHSFGQQGKKTYSNSNSNNKFKHFRMGTIASCEWECECLWVCNLNWIYTNTHQYIVQYFLNEFWKFMDDTWTMHNGQLGLPIKRRTYTHIHSKSCNKWKYEHTRTLYERTVTICGGGGGDCSGSVGGKCCALKHEYYFGPQLPKHILIDFMLTEMPNGNPEKRFRN